MKTGMEDVMSDLVIPDAVLADAHAAVMKSSAFNPQSQGDSWDAGVAVGVAAPVIARWARAEALREAREAVLGVEDSVVDPARGTTITKLAARAVIDALSKGENYE